MQREQLVRHIAEAYGAAPEFLWARYPNYAVFRHSANRKWFAVVMEVPKEKLGLPAGGLIQIVNFKCDPILLGSLRLEPGFFPAYHMNKGSWVTAALDGSVPEDKLKLLLALSFEATAPRPGKKAGSRPR